MKNIILAAMIALAGVTSVQLPAAQAATALVITEDGVAVRRVDRDRRHFRREVRRDRREFRNERRERREFRREMRREHCRTRTVRHYRNNRLIIEKVRVCG